MKKKYVSLDKKAVLKKVLGDKNVSKDVFDSLIAYLDQMAYEIIFPTLMDMEEDTALYGENSRITFLNGKRNAQLLTVTKEGVLTTCGEFIVLLETSADGSFQQITTYIGHKPDMSYEYHVISLMQNADGKYLKGTFGVHNTKDKSHTVIDTRIKEYDEEEIEKLGLTEIDSFPLTVGTSPASLKGETESLDNPKVDEYLGCLNDQTLFEYILDAFNEYNKRRLMEK